MGTDDEQQWSKQSLSYMSYMYSETVLYPETVSCIHPIGESNT